MGDPLAAGFVASVAHPGNNLTGLCGQGADTDGKRLELASDLVPKLKRLDLLFDANNPADVSDTTKLAKAGPSQGNGTAQAPGSQYDIRARSHRKWAIPGGDRMEFCAFSVHRDALFAFLSDRLPVIAEAKKYPAAGALVSYAPNWSEMYWRSAAYVDKILKGAKAGDLPIEQPTRFELVVNLRTAKFSA